MTQSELKNLGSMQSSAHQKNNKSVKQIKKHEHNFDSNPPPRHNRSMRFLT